MMAFYERFDEDSIQTKLLGTFDSRYTPSVLLSAAGIIHIILALISSDRIVYFALAGGFFTAALYSLRTEQS